MTTISDHVADIKRDGFIVLENVLSRNTLQSIRQDFLGSLQDGPFGRNEFEGLKTKRLYALLAKFPSVAEVVEHPAILEIVDALLPQSYLLSSAQAIQIFPGETHQAWHRDDSIDVLPMPRTHFGVSTIWALDDFTAANGATEIIPGSHLWGQDNPADATATAQAIEMSAGSVLVFLANVVHRGGANNSESPRLGLSPQYCAPWMRQSENMLLAVPQDRVALFSGRVQSLLGYEVVHPGFAGHVDGRHPKRLLERLSGS